MALTDEELIAHAAEAGLYLGANPARRLRFWTERNILPPKFAIRDLERETIAWRWPDYSRRCLDVLAAYASHPLNDVARIIAPLRTQWAAEDEARQAGREASASISELGAIFLALRRGGGIDKLTAACERAGMDEAIVRSTIDRVAKRGKMNDRQLADLVFILRRCWRLMPEPRDQALLLQVADHLDNQLRTTEDQP